MSGKQFDTEPLSAILAELRRRLEGADTAELIVPHPDLAHGLDPPRYPGEIVQRGGQPLRHRSLRSWLDLAERLECRLRLPQPVGRHHVRLVFERLGPEAPWHHSNTAPEDKYGATSPFARLDKLEEPRLLIDLLEAVERAAPPPGGRVLALGINDGKELGLFALHDPELAETLSFVGIDRSASALTLARARFAADRHHFVAADLTHPGTLEALDPGRFELIMALGVLQSPGIDDRALLRKLIRHHATPAGAVILSLPNSRYRGGEPLYGARMKNFGQPELGLLIKDVAFYRKYLQQHRYKVFVTGKYEVLVVGKRGRVGG